MTRSPKGSGRRNCANAGGRDALDSPCAAPPSSIQALRGAGAEADPVNPELLRTLLSSVRDGDVPVDEALTKLKNLPFEDLGFVKIDHHRSLRRGFPEVIFGPGKEPTEALEIVSRLADNGVPILVTKTDEATYSLIAQQLPRARWHEEARAITLVPDGDSSERSFEAHDGGAPSQAPEGTVAVLSAGTSDIPIAEEAALTAELMGCRVSRSFDVGVAGIHRLLAQRDRIEEASVTVVVAGMDGALPSVVSGMTSGPLVAVPTSIGYGASFGGLAALLTMLNACSPGVGVVNIDNGFGGGYLAGMICWRGTRGLDD